MMIFWLYTDKKYMKFNVLLSYTSTLKKNIFNFNKYLVEYCKYKDIWQEMSEMLIWFNNHFFYWTNIYLL